MIDPCYAAMLDGAVMANNPPTGLTAVPQDGTSASSQMNAIFAALPHANTNTRNVYFFRPTTRYKINARLDINVSGTAVLCGGGTRTTHLNQTGQSLQVPEEPWFRGSGLSPHIRMQNAEHIHWHGGSLRGRDNQTGGSVTQTAFDILTCRFTVVAHVYHIYGENLVQCNGLASGAWSEFCVIRDSKQLRSDGTTRPGSQWGQGNLQTISGKIRNCGLIGVWTVGDSHGPEHDEAWDCFMIGGYSESQGGGTGPLAVYHAGCLRAFWTANAEAVSAADVQSGASQTSIGGSGMSGGAGDWYRFYHGS